MTNPNPMDPTDRVDSVFHRLPASLRPVLPVLATAFLTLAASSEAVPFAIKYATNTTAQWNSAEWTDITVADDSQTTVSGPVGCAGTFTSNSMWNGEISYSNRVNGTNFWLYKAADADAWYITTNRTVNVPTTARWSMMVAGQLPYGGYGPAGVRPPVAAPYPPTTYTGIATNAFAFTTGAATAAPGANDTVIIGTDVASGRTNATIVVDGGTHNVRNVIIGFDNSGAYNSEIGTLVITNGATLNIDNDLNLGGNIPDRDRNASSMRTGIGIVDMATGTVLTVGRDLFITRSTFTVANARSVTVGRNLTLGNCYNTGSPYALQGLILDGATLVVPGTFYYSGAVRQTATLRLTNNAVLDIGGHFTSTVAANDTASFLTLDTRPGCLFNITSNFIFSAVSTMYDPASFQIGGGIAVCNGGAGGGTPVVAQLVQNGGTSTVSFLSIGDYTDSRGEYVMTNGAVLVLRRPTSGSVVNAVGLKTGTGSRGGPGARLTLGSATTAGDILLTGAGAGKHDLTVRGTTYSASTNAANNSYGDVVGWGKVELDGALIMNGRVVANGYGANRDLVMTNFASVSQNEAFAGFAYYNWMDFYTNKAGWYAVNGGRLTLPPLTISSGTSTQRWGDTINDFVITSNDLANSAMLICSNVTGGRVSLSVVATNRTDNNVLYPATVIGVWNVDGSGLTFGVGDATLTFRYDHQAAQARGLTEGDLKVWQYTTGWADVTAGVNTTDKTITTLPVRRFSLFAVSPDIPGRTPAILGTVLKIQ